MKKLLLSILTLISVSAFAQIQKDFAITMHLPVDSQEIVDATPFSLAFSIKNVGVDTIRNTDSILVVVFINSQILTTARANRSSNLKPGDSTIFALPNAFSFNITEDDIASFCVAGLYTDTLSNIDTLDENNISCNTVLLKVNATGVAEKMALANSVKVFPNPANSYLTITMKSSDASIEVMDITGKLVSTLPVTMGEARFDVSNYNNGVYFYQVKDTNGSLVKSGKFTVSH